MSKLTSTEMSRIAFLLDNVPEWNGIEGIHFGSLPLFDDSGELLGVIDFKDNLFESAA